MKTDGQTIRGHEIVIPHVNLESAKAWAKATLTKERIADIGVCVATVTVIGFVLFSLHRAMENHTILGF